ncbi:Plastidal glycolate/glycerate translocator 1, chloroplastic [Paramyrothecium foliicola]|nr:Plastidal glycolate/glycerate translocator 1, chloroplastic [Paramyrothecium foliicola]
MAILTAAADAATATKIAISRVANPSFSARLFRTWVLVPFGVTVILAGCFAIDTLFRKLNVSFPASVAGLVVLFLALLLCEVTAGAHRTRKVVGVIDVPAGWALRWINVFFTPSFVVLPLSPAIGAIEVLKIVAVFIIGFFVMMAVVAYGTRGIQALSGTTKRAQTQRLEELDEPLRDGAGGEVTDLSRRTSISQATSTVPLQPIDTTTTLQSPPELRLPNQRDNFGTGEEPPASAAPAVSLSHAAYPPQESALPPRAERWAARILAHFDLAVFAFLFFLIGLPVYYSVGYAMPFQLTVNLIAYFAAMALPPSWKQFLHPVLVSSFLAVLAIWPLALARGDDLTKALRDYRTGAKYLQLWANSGNQSALPGAGDVLGTLLDASIVALALPMFQYRREMRQHFAAIVVPSVAVSLGSLFAYPRLCYVVGISAERSLAFASRSLTLALATPATENLGGDPNAGAALPIMSGILGVLVGQKVLAFLRIPEDDYVTRGITLGVNSGAMVTALLLRTDPRGAALSSLSMSLFGTITVLFTSIPIMTNVVRSFVDL